MLDRGRSVRCIGWGRGTGLVDDGVGAIVGSTEELSSCLGFKDAGGSLDDVYLGGAGVGAGSELDCRDKVVASEGVAWRAGPKAEGPVVVSAGLPWRGIVKTCGSVSFADHAAAS